jgi:hypothetical protein
MCLITKQKRPEILKEDLIVYKELNNCWDSTTNDYEIKSCLTSFKYELGVLYQTEIKESEIPRNFDTIAWNLNFKPMSQKDRDLLYEQYSRLSDSTSDVRFFQELGYKVYGAGFHSFESKYRTNDINYECVIPAGSEVYRDKSGLIVSNQIIIKHRL